MAPPDRLPPAVLPSGDLYRVQVRAALARRGRRSEFEGLAHLVVDRLQGRDRSAGCLQFRRPSAPGHVCWLERCGRRYPFGRRTRELCRFSFPSPPALGLDRQLIEVDPAA